MKDREKREREIRDRLADLFGCFSDQVGDLKEALRDADRMSGVVVYWGHVPDYLK
ncbi:hypothetical protein LCGC14_2028790 [marine sediment metagenome]|uniref:Uncharacterized protein n=1 Tax=marine sediment metagenome TaxID=412755 RepID=A0A0F9H8R1_9ZZZZ